MGLLLAYVGAAHAISFLCSLLEATLLSTTPSYVRALAAERPELAERVKAFKDDVDRPLAAILTLNTFAHTIGAAGAGAQAAIVFGNAYVGLFSFVLTLTILVFTEIIPKTLGAAYWRELLPFATATTKWLIRLLGPLVWLSQKISGSLQRGEKQSDVSRDEFVAMAEMGAEQGVIEDRERRILEHLFRFRTLHAHDVMTPRTVLVTFSRHTTVREAVAEGLPFSRLPIYDGDRDHITGYVLEDEILEHHASGQGDLPLDVIRRDVLTVPESLALPDLFDNLLARREHLALVVDEYGGTAGIVTMEDIVETLLGLEILDEGDRTTDMQALARARWARRAARMGIRLDGATGSTPEAADSLPALLSDDPEAAATLIRRGIDDDRDGLDYDLSDGDDSTPPRASRRGDDDAPRLDGPETDAELDAEREAVARFGITGGTPPNAG